MDNFTTLFAYGMDRELMTPFDPMPTGFTHLNLGAGNKKIPGAIPLDWPDWDADTMAIPYPDNSVEVISAYHFLEHCADPVKVLLECQRVLVRRGYMNIVVPYYNSQMQAQDLDHKSVFCEETWRNLFKNPYYNKNKIEWKFNVHFNLIVGIKERNLALLTQLEKIS